MKRVNVLNFKWSFYLNVVMSGERLKTSGSIEFSNWL